jgi:hypothetical protein
MVTESLLNRMTNPSRPISVSDLCANSTIAETELGGREQVERRSNGVEHVRG